MPGRFVHEFVEKDINKRGGILLSANKYKNSYTLLKIKCKKCENIWMSSYHQIRQNYWCRKCWLKKKQKSTINYINTILKKRKGVLVFPYKNRNVPLKIKCLVCGKTFTRLIESIKNGAWCPCLNISKTDYKLYLIIKDWFNSAIYRYKKFHWLDGQEIDIYVSELKLAIEYDGKQHFAPVCFGGSKKSAKKKFKYTQKMDKLKNKKMKTHPEDIKYFIRIPYTESITKENVLKLLKEKGVVSQELINDM